MESGSFEIAEAKVQTNLAGLYIQIEAKKRRIYKIRVEIVPNWAEVR
jgi:hypothetical protein